MAHLANLGEHCSAADCRLKDFLPFECDCCEKKFCLSHRSYAAHGCPLAGGKDCLALTCPLCKKTVRWTESDDPNRAWERHNQSQDCNPERPLKKAKARCCAAGCKVKLGPSNTQTCSSCNQKTCLTHRFEDEHACPGRRGKVAQHWGAATFGFGGRGAAAPAAPAAAPRPRARGGRGRTGAAAAAGDPANTVRGTADRRRRGAPPDGAGAAAAGAATAAGAGAGPEACPQCGARFPDVGALIAHVEALHAGGGGGGGGGGVVDLTASPPQAPAATLEPCPYCGQRLPSVEQLVAHVEAHGAAGGAAAAAAATTAADRGRGSRCKVS